jgi:hypothetical protein
VSHYVQDVADTSDRWFLGVAAGLARVRDWARSFAGHSAEPAGHGAMLLVARPKPNKPKGGHVSGPRTTSRTTPRASAPNDEPVGFASFELLAGVTFGEAGPEPEPECAASSGAPERGSAQHRAGIVPLMRALGQVMTDHASSGYLSLEHDERFWTLLRIIRSFELPREADATALEAESLAEAADEHQAVERAKGP